MIISNTLKIIIFGIIAIIIGEFIAQSYATTQGDWMTTDFVPFEASLEFTNSKE